MVDMGHVTLLVRLDFSAAFDTVNHDILIHKLQSLLGLPGSALQWFRSYLRGRSQQVTINGALSKKFGLEYGVPQSSCLGPCFLLSMLANFSVLLNLTSRLHTHTQIMLNYTCHFAR